MSTKPVIFFSHIHEEKELAILLSDTLKKSFLGMVDIFVSSDEDSIRLGDEWLERVFESLQSAVAAFVLCSSASVSRPWINFEAGAAWIRKRLAGKPKSGESIQVVPICHTDMTPNALPLPLKLLKGIQVTDERALKGLVKFIADKLKSDEPTVDYKGLISEIEKFERAYGCIGRIAGAVRTLCLLDPTAFRSVFGPGSTSKRIEGEIERADYDKWKPHLRLLEDEKLIEVTLGGANFGYGKDGKKSIAGMYQELTIEVKADYNGIADEVWKRVGRLP